MDTLKLSNKTKELIGTLCIIASSILLYIDVGDSTLVNLSVVIVALLLMASFVVLIYPSIPEKHKKKFYVGILIAITLSVILFFIL